MRTYSHLLLTAVIGDRLKHRMPVHTKALLLGAVLPDVPLLLLTLGYMAYRRWLDPLQLHEPIYGPRYDALYFHSTVWITAHNVLHAPLLITLMTAVGYLGWRRRTAWGFAWLWFGIGCGLHSLTDILTHHNDGPLLLFPLDWTCRLWSPISYWDSRYHGDAVALVERLLDLCMLGYLPSDGSGEEAHRHSEGPAGPPAAGPPHSFGPRGRLIERMWSYQGLVGC